jgi:hypothetical protein
MTIRKKKRDPFYPITPSGPYSLYELMRFFSNTERRRHVVSRALGNLRLRKRGHKVRPLIDWRR